MIEENVYNLNRSGWRFLMWFRLAHYCYQTRFRRIIFTPIFGWYHIKYHRIIGIDIPEQTSIGKNFNIYHGFLYCSELTYNYWRQCNNETW